MPDTPFTPEVMQVIDAMEVRSVNYLPVVAAYCNAINLQGIVNAFVGSRMAVQPGAIVQAMVINTLNGRSPLYHLEEFMNEQDRELLLGHPYEAQDFSDTNLGRAMDAIFEAGASNLLTEIALSACVKFGIDCSRISYDTTSVSLWGDYRYCEEDDDEKENTVEPEDQPTVSSSKAPRITYGHSKDHNPDLKQVMMELLCVERGVPICGGCLDGNSSDKTCNNKMLTRISQLMKRHGLGPGAFAYVADSALVTEPNLKLVGTNPFVTRLPANFLECARAINEAVDSGNWTELGVLSELGSPPSRPSSNYRAAETKVVLYGQEYRAVVIHSDSHDRRMQKRLKKAIETSRERLAKLLKKQTMEYYCQADAEKAAELLRKKSDPMHTLKVMVAENEVRKPGRPPKNPEKSMRPKYTLKTEIQKNENGVQREKELAGCFVLLTNIPTEGDGSMNAKKLFLIYKGQYGVESNFAFLKDPIIVNDMFLKKNERIDVLGCILIISLLIWRLIERSMRNYLVTHGGTLPGWNRQQTERPTSYMMSTKFKGLLVIKIGNHRTIANRIGKEVLPYLVALGLNEKVFSTPGFQCKPMLK